MKMASILVFIIVIIVFVYVTSDFWAWSSFDFKFLSLSISPFHICTLWTEGPFEKFQFYVLPMKNLFFFPGISNLQNDLLIGKITKFLSLEQFTNS